MWTFRIYQDKGGQWRWRLFSRNRKIVADSAEGYAKRSNVVRAVRRFMTQIGRWNQFAVEEQK